MKMIVEIRLYRRWDADIISMHNYGYDIIRMVSLSLSSYANDELVQFRLSGDEKLFFPEKKMVHLRLLVEDPESVNLLKQIQPGYRNSFCKMLLRESLARNSFASLLTKKDYVQLEKRRIREVSDENTIPCPKRTDNPVKRSRNSKATREAIGDDSVLDDSVMDALGAIGDQ